MLESGNASDETKSWMVKHIGLSIWPETVASLNQRQLLQFQEKPVSQNYIVPYSWFRSTHHDTIDHPIEEQGNVF